MYSKKEPAEQPKAIKKTKMEIKRKQLDSKKRTKNQMRRACKIFIKSAAAPPCGSVATNCTYAIKACIRNGAKGVFVGSLRLFEWCLEEKRNLKNGDWKRNESTLRSNNRYWANGLQIWYLFVYSIILSSSTLTSETSCNTCCNRSHHSCISGLNCAKFELWLNKEAASHYSLIWNTFCNSECLWHKWGWIMLSEQIISIGLVRRARLNVSCDEMQLCFEPLFRFIPFQLFIAPLISIWCFYFP